MSCPSRSVCGRCGKADIHEWSGYRSFRCLEGRYSEVYACLCDACASAVRATNSHDTRVAPSTIGYDVKIERRSAALVIDTLESEHAVNLRLAALPTTHVREGVNDVAYEQRLRRADSNAFKRAASSFDGANVVESRPLDVGSQGSTSLLRRFLTVKARNMVFESNATAAVAALQGAIDELLQVVRPVTVEACWTLVSALQECVYEVQEVPPPQADVAAAAADPSHLSLHDIRASPLQLTSVAVESPLFFGAVLHVLFQQHTSVVTTLLDGAGWAAKRDDDVVVVETLAGLLVSGTHLMMVAATRQRDRCLIHQDHFWSKVVSCDALTSKHTVLDALRQSWPVDVKTQRTFNVDAYMAGFQQHLGIFISSFWGQTEVFKRSCDFNGGGKKSAVPAPNSTEAATTALDGNVMGNYMEGLRIVNNFIAYQPLCFVADGEALTAPSDVLLRGEMWARIGCQQLLDTLNRLLFRRATPTEAENAEAGGGIVWASAWQLAGWTFKQLCFTTFCDGSENTSLGDILEGVVEATEKAAATTPLPSTVRFDFGCNTVRDAALSKKVFNLLTLRGEAFLRSAQYGQSADVKKLPFHLMNFLCGKSTTATNANTDEVLRPCCEMHRRQREVASSTDFMKCTRCLLKVFFPDTPEEELHQLGERSYAALNLELKLQLRQVVEALVMRLHSVEEHIEYVLKMAFTATDAAHFKQLAQSYIERHLLAQSVALVQPYVDRMYDKLARASSESRLLTVTRTGDLVRLLRMPHGKLSDVVEDVRRLARNVTYVTVVADFVLDIDCDVHLPGVSLSLTAYKMRLHGSRTIDVSGRDALVRGSNGEHGANGTQDSPDGKEGGQGGSGLPGGDGGNIFLQHEFPLEAVDLGGERAVLTLLSRGGNGSGGGNGGAGGDGYSPPNMKDATLSMFSGPTHMGGRYSQFSIEPLECSTKPGKAGMGGGLGSGGLGGRRGEIWVVLHHVGPLTSISVPSGNVNGNDGAIGCAGPPGKGGRGGRDGQMLSLTRKNPWWGSSKWIEEFSCYVLKKNGEYYDGKKIVRGKEPGSTGHTRLVVGGGRCMDRNYTYGCYVCLAPSHWICSSALKSRQYVCGGVVRNRDDLKNGSSSSVSNPVEQSEQRLSFQALQEAIKGTADDFVAAQRAVPGMAELRVDAAALGTLATETRHEVSLLDNLLSRSLPEAIVAMECSASFTEAFEKLEREAVQTKAQVLREWKRSTGGSDERDSCDDDTSEDESSCTADDASETKIQVLEFHAAGPLYDLRAEIAAFNLMAMSVRRGASPLAVYLRQLTVLMQAIEGSFASSGFVMTYAACFYSRSLFLVESELNRVSAAQLLIICQPTDDGVHIPSRVAQCAYRALSRRYVANMANGIAASADGRGAVVALKDGVSLGKLRLCAERMQFCAPTQIGPLLSQADVRIPVCPLFALGDTPTFCRQWVAVLKLGSLLVLDPCKVKLPRLLAAFEKARSEFLNWLRSSAASRERARLFAHSLPRRVFDWLLSVAGVCDVKFMADTVSEAVVDAAQNLAKAAPSLSVVVLDTWKDVLPPTELFSQLLQSAARGLPDESDAKGRPPSSQLVKTLTSLLGFLWESEVFASETAQIRLLVKQFQGSQKAFVVPLIRMLKMRFLVQRTQVFRGSRRDSCPAESCFCEWSIGEGWGIEKAVQALVELDNDEDHGVWYWRTPCWNCCKHWRDLLHKSPGFQSKNSKDVEQAQAAVERGHALSVASFIEAKVPLMLDAMVAGWHQVTPGSEAALLTKWLSDLYDAILTADPQQAALAVILHVLCNDTRLVPPSKDIFDKLQRATRWGHLPPHFDVRVWRKCSCFPIRKHAASRLLEEVNGPYTQRIRALVQKAVTVVSDNELHASLHAALALEDMEHVLRTLCHHYLIHLGSGIFGKEDFARHLEEPLEALTKYASVEVVLLVTDVLEKEQGEAKGGRVAYPEYVGAALCALEGLSVTDSVAAALTSQGLSCCMTALQRRRFFQCVHLWWTSRGVLFPVHEMYNWLLHCGENSFGRFMELTRSLTDATVGDVLRDFVAVPAPQRGSLGKLQDALKGGHLTKNGVEAYKRAWETKRWDVVRGIEQLDQQELHRTANRWERGWDDITAFLRDENVTIPAELVKRSMCIYDDIRTSSTSPVASRQKRLERFVKAYKSNAAAAASNDGTRHVKATEARILGSEEETRSTLVDILLGYWASKGYLPRRVQVLAVLALLQGSVLANINTSEGKTYIAGCVIAFKLFCGYRVAFATSTSDLAKEAMNFNKGAFTLLFTDQLPATAEDAETAKSNDTVYKAHVVYTTEANLRARELRRRQDPTDERYYREWRGFTHWVILDEADVSMIQNLTEAMYVGGPSLDARRDVLTYPALMFSAAKGESREVAREAWVQRMGILSRDSKDPLLSWKHFQRVAASAHDVWELAHDQEYVTVNGMSVPYNTETGETLYTTSLMDGLSTMTCIKERQRWEWETEASVTMNPLLLFSVCFRGRMTAVTGTAGGYATQAVYNRVYDLQPVVIPPAFPSLFQELPHELYSNAAAYDAGIERSIRGAIGRGQDVLVAVKTVAEADRLLGKMRTRFTRGQTTTTTVHFQRYAREKMDLVPRLSAGVRHVFFMTFLGGRGLDVTPHERQPNGVHVVLCCAQHERATHQVLRRAARQFYPGSGQIICLLDTQTADPADFTTDLMTREDFFKHQNRAVESERLRLQILITREIPQALLGEELQKKVQSCVRQLRQKQGLYLCVSFVVQHSFAAWLSSKRDDIAEKGLDRRFRDELMADLEQNVTNRFLDATINDEAALARLLRTTNERVVVATALRGTQLDLPWCTPRVYQIFEKVPNGLCPHLIPELIHALEAASRGNVEGVRKNVLAFTDGLSRWIAAHEQFAVDLNQLYSEAGGGDGDGDDGTESCRTLTSVHASITFLTALQERYTRLVGTNGVLYLSVFQQRALDFAHAVVMLEALVKHGFVTDPSLTAKEKAAWATTYAEIQRVVPGLQQQPCGAPPSTSLGFVLLCQKNGVDMGVLDAVFSGAAPLLPPLRVAETVFHEHVQTYVERFEGKNIPNEEKAVEILLGCVGLLRKDQVQSVRVVPAHRALDGNVDKDTIWEWTCLGYQHVVDVVERENSSKNQAMIDEEERKKAEANSFWGRAKSFLWTAGMFVVDMAVNALANTVIPGAGFIIKNIVTPFIKSGINLVKAYVETGKVQLQKFFTEGLSGAVMNCAASCLRRVGQGLADKFSKTGVGQSIIKTYEAGKEKVARFIHEGKKFAGKLADKIGINYRLTRAAVRMGSLMALRSGKKLVTNAITKKCVGDLKQNVDDVMRKRLTAPLLVLLLTVKRQKPSQYKRFLQQLVPHIQKGMGDVNIVEQLFGGSSVVQTFDQTLRRSCKTSNEETAGLIYSLVDSASFVRAACTGPRQAVEGVCDEYLSKSWAYATTEFAVDPKQRESADGVSPDGEQSRVLSQFQQLVVDRAVQPIRNFVNDFASSCINSIRTAVDHIEQEEQRELEVRKSVQELRARLTGSTALHDSSRFTLYDSVLPSTAAFLGVGKLPIGAPKGGVLTSFLSPPPKKGYLDHIIDVGEKCVDFLQIDEVKLVVAACVFLSVRDRELVEQVLRVLDGETVLPPVTLPERPTKFEVFLILCLILYERFKVHRRLDCSTLKEAVLELAVAVLSAMASSHCRFDAELQKLPLADDASGELRTLFGHAAEYADMAYKEASWGAATLSKKGRDLHDPTFQIYLNNPKQLVVLAFRGSTTKLDYLSDSLCLSENFCGAVAHCGFASIVKTFFGNPCALKELQKLAAANPSYRVLITGHSLGGSVAILTGLKIIHDRALDNDVLQRMFVVAVAGAPATTHLFTEADRFYNLVNHMDIVPRAQLNSIDRLLQELLSDTDTSMERAPDLVQPKNTYLVSEDRDGLLTASPAMTSSIYCAPCMMGDHSCEVYLKIFTE